MSEVIYFVFRFRLDQWKHTYAATDDIMIKVVIVEEHVAYLMYLTSIQWCHDHNRCISLIVIKKQAEIFAKAPGSSQICRVYFHSGRRCAEQNWDQ